MKSWTIFFCLLTLLVISNASNAQAAELTKIQPYGFASLNVETNDSLSYDWRWARIGVKAYPYSAQLKDTLMVRFEYDLTSTSIKYGYVQLDRPWHGGKTSFLAGQFLAPIQYFYPGPAGLRLTRWPDMEGRFSVYGSGVSLHYENGPLSFKAAHFGSGQVSTTIGFGALSLGWEDMIGYTAAFQGAYLSSKWVKIFLGYSKFNDDELGDSFFVQNYWEVFDPSLRLYAQYEFGDQDESWLTGLSWAYSKNSFIKVFYDTTVNELKDGDLKLELTFAF
jgi:hypothetical protein